MSILKEAEDELYEHKKKEQKRILKIHIERRDVTKELLVTQEVNVLKIASMSVDEFKESNFYRGRE